MNFIFAWFLIAHFIGDFVLQRNIWAKNKSSSNIALSKHVAVYTLTLALPCVILFGLQAGFLLAVFNGAMHWFIDYVTSRQTKRLWNLQRVHDFFVVVGFDQLLHYLVMLFSLWYFGSVA